MKLNLSILRETKTNQKMNLNFFLIKFYFIIIYFVFIFFREGKGIYKYPDGSYYEGDYKNDKK
jgi:hypothetical protein